MLQTAVAILSLLSLAAPAQAERAGDITVGAGDIFLVRHSHEGGRPLWAELDGRRFPAIMMEEEMSFFLLGFDLEAEPGRYPLRIVLDGQGAGERKATVTVHAREFPTEELSLPENMVTPPAEVLERIAAERKAAAAVYATTAPKPIWAPPFSRPVEGSPSGNFGRRRILNGKPRSPHSGEDYSADRGAKVRAVGRGRVRMARDLYYSGKTILLDHGGGLVSQYFHLDTILVEEGQLVEKEDPVGRVGATGRVTGPHLHFGIRLFGMRSDPSLLWGLFAD